MSTDRGRPPSVRAPLPVDEALPRLEGALREHPNLVLVAPPGAGKTTRVPPLLLRLVGPGQRVLMLQPRRIAARASAARIAQERGTPLGQEVGYQVRFERRASAATRLLVVTEGILLRRLVDDPFLEDVGAVVLDELHERSLDLDLSLALTRRVQQEARPDLRVVAMSATLDPGPVATYLGGAPVVEVPGRAFPVEVRYRPLADRRDWEPGLVRAVLEALEAQAQGVLVFLPGWREIRRAEAALRGPVGGRAVLCPLHGDLPPEAQDAVLAPGGPRRVVLSTNVAETSLTIPGIGAVVDLGLARSPRYEPSSGLVRLATVRIARAAAEQRAGRAGRLGPGLALRLWSEGEQRALEPFEPPEVRRSDLAGAALSLLAFGERDLLAFPWFEAPPRATLESALDLLRRLGALDARGTLTPVGAALARLPLHPRLARVALEGERLGVPRRAALAAALLAERDPLRREAAGAFTQRGRESDVLLRVEALERLERGGGGEGLERGSAQAILRARDQVAALLGAGTRGGRDHTDGPAADEALLRALLAGFPDRVALRRRPRAPEAVMLGQRGVRLAAESSVREAEWFLVLDADAPPGRERAEALVTQASALDPAWLDPAEERTTDEARFDEAAGRVVARRVTRYGDLVVRSVETGDLDPEQAAVALAEAAGRDLAPSLGLPQNPEAEQWLARARCLAAWRPDLGLPAFDDDWVRGTLPLLCAGRRSLADLRRAPLVDLWTGLLPHAQASALARLAPERLEVPSGSRIALRYEPGRPPVLAARIQELFGLAETPRVAGGRVPVLLHLLAPNGRPQQVTDDLRSFWNVAYHEVRKELRARYPRHAWPEDPWTAPAERRPRRRP